MCVRLPISGYHPDLSGTRGDAAGNKQRGNRASWRTGRLNVKLQQLLCFQIDPVKEKEIHHLEPAVQVMTLWP